MKAKLLIDCMGYEHIGGEPIKVQRKAGDVIGDPNAWRLCTPEINKAEPADEECMEKLSTWLAMQAEVKARRKSQRLEEHKRRRAAAEKKAAARRERIAERH